jgi:voltage-gated potassium channel
MPLTLDSLCKANENGVSRTEPEMSESPVSPPRLSTFWSRLRHVPPVDWIMLTLALVSIGMLSYETWGPATEAQRRQIILADLFICAIFAIEFTVRWSRNGWAGSYVLRNWYEILGMIPVAHPALRAFRLFRLVRIVVLLARFGAAADRAFGDEFTYRVINRVRDGVVEAIGGAVTLYVLDEVGTVLNKGTYTQNIARALRENHTELRAMIAEKLREDPRTGRLRRLPFYEDIVNTVIDALLDVTMATLNDPRTDELVADMLRENLSQIREAVREHETSRGHLG